MATQNTAAPAPPAVMLPEGTLLLGTQEQDGVVTETAAFRVVQGVVEVETVKRDGKLAGLTVQYHHGARLEPLLVNGQQTTGVLTKGRG